MWKGGATEKNDRGQQCEDLWKHKVIGNYHGFLSGEVRIWFRWIEDDYYTSISFVWWCEESLLL